MRVMLLGATGLTGSLVLERLLSAPEVTEVVAAVRRTLGNSHPKLKEQVVDFDQLESHKALFAVDAMICCLGTTIKKAGSRERFRAVDHDYVLAAAKLGREQGAKAFVLMSAIGASPKSPVFYNRVKGELEADIEGLDFPFLSIYQPGLLMSEREEQRGLESVGISVMRGLNPLMVGPMSAYRGIEPAVIATAMVHEICRVANLDSEQMPAGGRRQYGDIVALSRA